MLELRKAEQLRKGEIPKRKGAQPKITSAYLRQAIAKIVCLGSVPKLSILFLIFSSEQRAIYPANERFIFSKPQSVRADEYMARTNASGATGFHDFFRYAIPGYGLVAVVLATIWLVNPSMFPSSDLQDITAWVISGPFIGFLIQHALYYPVWTLYYIRCSKAYKSVKQTIKHISISVRSELAEYDDSDSTRQLLTRCIWDFVYFSDDNRVARNRIQFLLTTVHSIGATLVSIWLGFAFGLFYLFQRNYAELSFTAQTESNFVRSTTYGIVEWYWVAIVLLVVTSGLVYSFWDRKRLAENQEYLLVLQNRDAIRIEVLKKISSSQDPFR